MADEHTDVEAPDAHDDISRGSVCNDEATSCCLPYPLSPCTLPVGSTSVDGQPLTTSQAPQPPPKEDTIILPTLLPAPPYNPKNSRRTSGSKIVHKMCRMAVARNIRIIDLSLRLLAVILTLISFVLIAADSHVVLMVFNNPMESKSVHNWTDSSKFELFGSYNHIATDSDASLRVTSITFTNFSTYNYGLSKRRSGWRPRPATYYISFISDQVCAYLLLSGTSASFSLTNILISLIGNSNGVSRFISQANASASVGFLAFCVVSASTLLSGYGLLFEM